MRQEAPATRRNRKPILDVLRRVFPSSGIALEVASGSGEHAVFFGEALAPLRWQPTDVEHTAIASIDAWREHAGFDNVLRALQLDVTSTRLEAFDGVMFYDAMFCANLIHIAPWNACEGLMRVAGSVLRPGAPLVLYGPFKVDGAHTAPSNEDFDVWLKQQNVAYGVRDFERVVSSAVERGLTFNERIVMPANNFCLVFQRAG